MQEFIKIVLVGILTAFAVLIIKGTKPEFTVFITIAGCCIILAAIAGKIGSIAQSVNEIVGKTGIDNEFCTEIIKISGMCFLCNFAAETCNDCGCGSVGRAVETAGRVCVTISILPFAVSLLDTVAGIISGSVF